MEEKINDIKNYALRMFGITETSVKEEENPIDENLRKDARRLAINQDNRKNY